MFNIILVCLVCLTLSLVCRILYNQGVHNLSISFPDYKYFSYITNQIKETKRVALSRRLTTFGVSGEAEEMSWVGDVEVI